MQPRLNQGIAGRGKGQLVDDDQPKCRATNVHTLPETAGSEQYGVRRAAKLRQEFGTRPLALYQQRPGQRPAVNPPAGRVECPIAGKQQESPAAAGFDQRPDAGKNSFDVVRGCRLR